MQKKIQNIAYFPWWANGSITAFASWPNAISDVESKDVMVTMFMEGVPHVLTLDYILSAGPARLTFSPQARLTMGAPPADSGWERLPSRWLHGVFAVHKMLLYHRRFPLLLQ